VAANGSVPKEAPMKRDPASDLGKRERQIMEIVYRRGRATASQVLEDLPDPPTYSAVRGMLRYLEDKGYLKHQQDGPRYVYAPASPKREVRASALSHVVRTFFDGSVSTAVASLLENESLSRDEYDRLTKLLNAARPEDSK
jgi:BlaI family transcriptional regulator, penicillinase repressor